MTYEELSEKLIANSFYPALVSRLKSKSKVVEGLQVDSPSLLKDERKKKLEEIVGKNFKVSWQGNGESNEHFLIQKI